MKSSFIKDSKHPASIDPHPNSEEIFTATPNDSLTAPLSIGQLHIGRRPGAQRIGGLPRLPSLDLAASVLNDPRSSVMLGRPETIRVAKDLFGIVHKLANAVLNKTDQHPEENSLFATGPGFRFERPAYDATHVTVTIDPKLGHQKLVFALDLLGPMLSDLSYSERHAVVKTAAALPPGWPRAQSIANLAPHLSDLQPRSIDLLLATLAAPQEHEAFEASWGRCYAIAALCQHMPLANVKHQATLLSLAVSPPEETQRAYCLRAVAERLPQMPNDQRGAALTMLNNADFSSDTAYACLLAGYAVAAKVLDPAQRETILTEAFAFPAGTARHIALTGIAPHAKEFGTDIAQQLLQLAETTTEPPERAALLAGLCRGEDTPADDRAKALDGLLKLPDPTLRQASFNSIGPAIALLSPRQIRDAYTAILTGQEASRQAIDANLELTALLPPPMATLSTEQLGGVIEALTSLRRGAGKAMAIVSMLAWDQPWTTEQRDCLVGIGCNIREPEARAAATIAMLALPPALTIGSKYGDRHPLDLQKSLDNLSDAPLLGLAIHRALAGLPDSGAESTRLDDTLLDRLRRDGRPLVSHFATTQLLRSPARVSPEEREKLYATAMIHGPPGQQKVRTGIGRDRLIALVRLRLQEDKNHIGRFPLRNVCSAIHEVRDAKLALEAVKPILQAMRDIDTKKPSMSTTSHEAWTPYNSADIDALLQMCGKKNRPSDSDAPGIDLKTAFRLANYLRKLVNEFAPKAEDATDWFGAHRKFPRKSFDILRMDLPNLEQQLKRWSQHLELDRPMNLDLTLLQQALETNMSEL